MRLDDFVLKVKNILGVSEFYCIQEGESVYRSTGPRDSLYVSWVTGGVTGGSCWDTGDDDPHHDLAGDPEPEFSDLDKILEYFCPRISFLQHKAILRDVVKRTEHSVNEYYGNYTDYGVKYFKVEELYSYLMSKGLVGSPDSIIKEIT